MGANRKTPASMVALGGMLAALAIVIMGLGTLLPIATYACPILATMLLAMVQKLCGSRIAWAWYGAVAILSVLISPDKEAAGVFVFLGYYPILKKRFDGCRFKTLWKALYFNVSILVLYWLLLKLFGLEGLTEDFRGLGLVGLGAMVLMGNGIFFLLDRLLGGRYRRAA